MIVNRRAVFGSLAALALAALIGWFGRFRASDEPVGVNDEEIQSDPAREIGEPALMTPAPASDRDRVLVDEAAPGGSMRDYLLATPAGNRNRILRLAVTDAGFECRSVKAASVVGTPGAVWRANCGATQVYWIELDQFSRFSVMPMPYGDGVGPMPPVRIVQPGDSDRQ